VKETFGESEQRKTDNEENATTGGTGIRRTGPGKSTMESYWNAAMKSWVMK